MKDFLGAASKIGLSTFVDLSTDDVMIDGDLELREKLSSLAVGVTFCSLFSEVSRNLVLGVELNFVLPL